MSDPLSLRLGSYFHSGLRRWPGSELILTTDGGLFHVDVVAPTPADITDFDTAAMEFAWTEARHHGVLCYRFGERPWQHYAFNPHRDTPPGVVAGLPEIGPGETLSVTLGLAEVDRTPVLAVRTAEWPEHFVGAVRATLARLAAQSVDSALLVGECDDLHLFVGSERIAQRAGVRCRCG
ncbi:hypothetical protein NN3_15160 [Nocardia neocaledoniensis NBRC 108232]|uniref:Uncharacterized protein n=2 Tax=Nocardia neocaledoniensis TaxID=236511 RepID=A0A317NIT0_9NOCA|nr:hypothetical protein DFR69_10581 [Nocardia neocaledoniensis]GEM30509.1 hypothetical protein NN3_15160 [Nocardia neocaledoniensis NBRC 108232]